MRRAGWKKPERPQGPELIYVNENGAKVPIHKTSCSSLRCQSCSGLGHWDLPRDHNTIPVTEADDWFQEQIVRARYSVRTLYEQRQSDEVDEYQDAIDDLTPVVREAMLRHSDKGLREVLDDPRFAHASHVSPMAKLIARGIINTHLRELVESLSGD